MRIDTLHRLILDELLVEFKIADFTPQEVDHLNRVWHRLMPWPDSMPGLNRLRCRYITAFVPRPLEQGPNAEIDATPDPAFDVHANDFFNLAEQLGA